MIDQSNSINYRSAVNNDDSSKIDSEDSTSDHSLYSSQDSDANNVFVEHIILENFKSVIKFIYLSYWWTIKFPYKILTEHSTEAFWHYLENFYISFVLYPTCLFMYGGFQSPYLKIFNYTLVRMTIFSYICLTFYFQDSMLPYLPTFIIWSFNSLASIKQKICQRSVHDPVTPAHYITSNHADPMLSPSSFESDSQYFESGSWETADSSWEEITSSFEEMTSSWESMTGSWKAAPTSSSASLPTHSPYTYCIEIPSMKIYVVQSLPENDQFFK